MNSLVYVAVRVLHPLLHMKTLPEFLDLVGTLPVG